MEGNMGWIIAAIIGMGTFLAWFTNISIKTQLGDFKDSLRDEFGKRFLDATLAAAKLDPMQKTIDHHTGWIQQVEDSADVLRDEIRKCKVKIGVD